MFPGRIVLLAPNLARPRSAASPGSPTRPARGMSGFLIRQVISRTILGHALHEKVLVEYALRLIQTYGNELCSALGGWLKSASFVCVAVSAV